MNLDRAKQFMYWSAGVCLLTLGLLAISVSWQVYLTTPRYEAIEKAVGDRLAQRDDQVKAVLSNVQKMVKDTEALSEASYNDTWANVQTVTVILREASEVVHTMRLELLPEVILTVKEARATIHTGSELLVEMKRDVGLLTTEATGPMRSLQTTIDRAGTLLETLDGEVKEGSPKVGETFEELAKTFKDINTMLEDPNVKELLAHVNGTADSVDVIMKRLATKAGMLKVILGTLSDFLKFDVSKLF